jgi:2,5-diamino-6-(ribosylamino)-4(3H)-pyrimidinone 5'-phosphate reductase
MIEGGARVISSFLHAPRRDDGTAMVDSVVVTCAPMFIGDGVDAIPPVC